jgi:hypothetical protein
MFDSRERDWMHAGACDLDVYSHIEGEPWLKVYVQVRNNKSGRESELFSAFPPFVFGDERGGGNDEAKKQ